MPMELDEARRVAKRMLAGLTEPGGHGGNSQVQAEALRALLAATEVIPTERGYWISEDEAQRIIDGMP